VALSLPWLAQGFLRVRLPLLRQSPHLLPSHLLKCLPRQIGSTHTSVSMAALLCDLSTDTKQQWCNICLNGGSLVLCSSCTRGSCLKCLGFPEDAARLEGDFTCVSCWKSSRPREPYKVRPFTSSFMYHLTRRTAGSVEPDEAHYYLRPLLCKVYVSLA
jgi:hypothetical protein